MQVGERRGRLTVTGFAKIGAKGELGLVCKCDCGSVKTYYKSNVMRRLDPSCGCLRNEKTSQRSKVIHKKHGMRLSREYKSWISMKERCLNPAHPHYGAYAGRGITVCREWLDSFEAFYENLGSKPFPNSSIERIDNSKGYMPGNCRWATAKEQANNRRDNVIVNYRGKSMTMKQASELSGVNYSTVKERRRRGWPESLWFM